MAKDNLITILSIIPHHNSINVPLGYVLCDVLTQDRYSLQGVGSEVLCNAHSDTHKHVDCVNCPLSTSFKETYLGKG